MFVLMMKLVFLFCVVVVNTGLGDIQTLFNQNDKVIVYNNETYENGLYNNDKAHTFLLYSSLCPHCQRFAPFYKELAEEVYNRSAEVEITAVDCVYDGDVCMKFNIEGYPTIRFIPPTANQTDIGVTFTGHRSITDIKRWLTAQLSEVNPRLSNRSNLKR